MFISKVQKKIKDLLYRFVLKHFGLGNRVSKVLWDNQYESGIWNYLELEDEKQHYLEIVNLINVSQHSDSILDIGCGHGVLISYLTQNTKNQFSYLGIDISSVAIEKAKKRFAELDFRSIDFEKTSLKEKFDIIIFNESLYYFTFPSKIINKCIFENLNEGGSIIVSMCKYDGHEEIWKDLNKSMSLLKSISIKNSKNQIWDIAHYVVRHKTS